MKTIRLIFLTAALPLLAVPLFAQNGTHTLTGTVHLPDGSPAAGVQVMQVVFGGGAKTETDAQGRFDLAYRPPPAASGQPTPCLLARDEAHNLAVAQDLEEGKNAYDLKLAPALTLAGRVECDGKLLTNQVSVQVVFLQTDRGGTWVENLAHTNVPGQYEIPALPTDRKYGLVVSAPGYGQRQNPNLTLSDEPGRQELEPIKLIPANLKLAGQVLDADEKPVANCYVSIYGENQPNGLTRTDSEGRFEFDQVCAGPVQVHAGGQGTDYGRISAEGGDTNVVLQLGQHLGSSGYQPAPVRPIALKGKPLPDLTSVHLTAAEAPAGQPVVLCLFDANQRPSRHALQVLNQQAAALQARHVTVLAVQVSVLSDAAFNEWKTTSGVTFPVGRVTETTEQTKWATRLTALPWLVLADAKHVVAAEGFSLDDLPSQLDKLAK